MHIVKLKMSYDAIYYAIFRHGELSNPIILLTEAEFDRFLAECQEQKAIKL